MTLEEFNYQTRRVHTHSSEESVSDRTVSWLLLLFVWWTAGLAALIASTTRQTNFIIRFSRFFPRRGIGFHIKTSATDRRSLCSAESDAFDRTPATTTSTTSCKTRRSVWEEGREEMKKRRREKKGNGEATQYLMILDRSNDFPSQQRRYSLSHSHQWICVYENVRAVKFQLHRSTERCKAKKGMKNYNSFYVKRCDGRRGKIKVQIPIVFFSVFFPPLSSFHFFAALVSYTNILLQCSFSSSLRCALSGHRKTYPITRP